MLNLILQPCFEGPKIVGGQIRLGCLLSGTCPCTSVQATSGGQPVFQAHVRVCGVHRHMCENDHAHVLQGCTVAVPGRSQRCCPRHGMCSLWCRIPAASGLLCRWLFLPEHACAYKGCGLPAGGQSQMPGPGCPAGGCAYTGACMHRSQHWLQGACKTCCWRRALAGSGLLCRHDVSWAWCVWARGQSARNREAALAQGGGSRQCGTGPVQTEDAWASMCGHLWLRRLKPFRSSPASQQQGFTSLYPSVASESSRLGQASSPQWSRHSHVWPNLLKVAHDEQDIGAALPPLMPHLELAAMAEEDVPRLADPFGSQAGPSSLIGVPLNPTRDWDAAEKLLRCTWAACKC